MMVNSPASLNWYAFVSYSSFLFHLPLCRLSFLVSLPPLLCIHIYSMVAHIFSQQSHRTGFSRYLQYVQDFSTELTSCRELLKLNIGHDMRCNSLLCVVHLAIFCQKECFTQKGVA